MTVTGISGADIFSQQMKGGLQQSDPYSREIQGQIKRKQEELRKLSEDKDTSPEEKLKKRQEIEQDISALNTQLREHQMQQRKEERNKGTSIEDMLGGKPRTAASDKNGKKMGVSDAGMQAVLAADSSMKQAQVQGNVAMQAEGRAAVLRSEIKQDGGKGTGQKEEELAKTEQVADKAAAAQMGTLGEVNKSIQEAKEEEAKAKKEEKSQKTESSEKEEKSKKEETSEKEEVPENYVPVDVRL